MKKRSNLAIAGQLISLVKPLTGFMILAIVLGLIGHLCAAFIPILGSLAVTELLTGTSFFPLSTIFVLVWVLALMRGGLHYGEQSCNHYIAFKLLALIRDKTFAALRRLCPAKLEVKDKGNLISIITSDVELLEVFYAHTISPIAIAFLMSVIMVLFIGQFHWSLGLVAALAYISVGLIVPIITSKQGGEDGLRFRNQAGELSSFVLDSLRGLGETLQFHGAQSRLTEMGKKTEVLSEYEQTMKIKSGRSMAITGAIILLFDTGMLFLAAWLHQNGFIDFGAVLIAVVSLMSSFGPVIALANLGGSLQNTFAAGNRVLDILEDTPQVKEISGQPDIVFTGAASQNLSFAYDDEMILSDMSLSIPQNSIVGLVGKSGSGKSTFLRLLMRFWETQTGQITISDKPINAINTANLRNIESFMTQETQLFHDSIENNLRIAKLDATDQEIETACRQAAIHDFIMRLPQGYQTPVGELGSTLSGGERQRLGLARIFLHNAPFMLFDEPTSNLDSLNEAVILKSIVDQRQNKTVVLVSHRKSTMTIADQIHTVEHGRMS